MELLLEKLGLEPHILLAQIINFLILIFVLRRFLYKPLIKFLDKRKDIIEKGLNDAQKAKEELSKIQTIKEEKIIEVSKKVFSKISYREKPDGFLAVAKIKDKKLADLKLSANPLLVVLEAVEKPGNLGAILRTADAAGADAVIINDAKTDIYSPNVIRASQGTVFTIAAILSSAAETIEFCKNNKKIPTT